MSILSKHGYWMSGEYGPSIDFLDILLNVLYMCYRKKSPNINGSNVITSKLDTLCIEHSCYYWNAQILMFSC